jgi:DNA-binding NarL/FixJ family response regulator
MHGLSGIEASQRLLHNRPGTPIVILSIHRDEIVVQRAFDAGALAYVDKLSAGDDLIPAIRAALDGKRFISGSCKIRPV